MSRDLYGRSPRPDEAYQSRLRMNGRKDGYLLSALLQVVLYSMVCIASFPENRTRKKFAWFAMVSPDSFSYTSRIISRFMRRKEDQHGALFKEARPLLLANTASCTRGSLIRSFSRSPSAYSVAILRTG